MALPPLVTVEEFKQWPEVTVSGTDGETRAEAVLVAVSSKARAAASRTWVDEEGDLTEVPDVVKAIVVSVAARVWANPAATSQHGQGPFTAAWAANLQGLALTEEEREEIRASVAEDGSTPGLWTLSTTRGDMETGTVYAPVSYPGADPIPMLNRDPMW